MIFDLPSKTGFVVYSKTDCIFCSKVKMLLNDCNLDFKEIKCDKYILDNKTSFFSFMSEISMTQINTFYTNVIYKSKRKVLNIAIRLKISVNFQPPQKKKE